MGKRESAAIALTDCIDAAAVAQNAGKQEERSGEKSEVHDAV